MRPLIIFIFVSIFEINIFAQKIYNRVSTYDGSIIARVEQGYVYANNSTMISSLIFYFDGKYIYQLKGSRSYTSSDVVATYSNGYIYRGKSMMRTDAIGRFQNNKLYDGCSTMKKDCLFTYIGNKVYAGDSTMYKDVIMNTSSYVHPIILLFIMTL